MILTLNSPITRLTGTRYRKASEETGEFSRRSFSLVNWVKIWRTPHPCHPAPSAAAVSLTPLVRAFSTTTLLPNPRSPFSPWNARHNGGGDDVDGMRTCDWPKARWRHGGESLHALVCNPPWTPCYLDRGNPLPLPSVLAAHRTRRGAIGIEKWCTAVQSHSFPRLSDPRGRRASLAFFVVSPILRPAKEPFLSSTAIKTISVASFYSRHVYIYIYVYHIYINIHYIHQYHPYITAHARIQPLAPFLHLFLVLHFISFHKIVHLFEVNLASCPL